MIKFRYRMDNTLYNLVTDNMDYTSYYLDGYMEEGLSEYQLSRYRLYLVCEEVNYNSDKSSEVININPIAIVAKDEYAAVYLYNKITGKEYCNVIFEIKNRCAKLVVEI